MIQQYYYVYAIEPDTRQRIYLAGSFLSYWEAELNIYAAKVTAFKKRIKLHSFAVQGSARQITITL